MQVSGASGPSQAAASVLTSVYRASVETEADMALKLLTTSLESLPALQTMQMAGQIIDAYA